ncbi:MAG TPA: hypothetical protein VGP63_15370 [Planctomycetaceae bacterium]|nr:hypothetical protein [Planctomycetaceae bacterium]
MPFDWSLVPLLASDADGIWVLIPLAAITIGGVGAIMKMVMNHRERMAKIGMGIDPDAPPQDDSTGSRG